jgi:hypothetical protein
MRDTLRTSFHLSKTLCMTWIREELRRNPDENELTPGQSTNQWLASSIIHS